MLFRTVTSGTWFQKMNHTSNKGKPTSKAIMATPEKRVTQDSDFPTLD